MLLGRRKSFENTGCADERKYDNEENKSCSSIIKNHGWDVQGCFSRRGKMRGSWMDMFIIFRIFFALVVIISNLEPPIYVALKMQLRKVFYDIPRLQIQMATSISSIYLEHGMSLWWSLF